MDAQQYKRLLLQQQQQQQHSAMIDLTQPSQEHSHPLSTSTSNPPHSYTYRASQPNTATGQREASTSGHFSAPSAAAPSPRSSTAAAPATAPAPASAVTASTDPPPSVSTHLSTWRAAFEQAFQALDHSFMTGAQQKNSTETIDESQMAKLYSAYMQLEMQTDQMLMYLHEHEQRCLLELGEVGCDTESVSAEQQRESISLGAALMRAQMKLHQKAAERYEQSIRETQQQEQQHDTTVMEMQTT